MPVLPRAPEELSQGKLKRLGEGLGKVIYASPHWVIKRERSKADILALIVIYMAWRRLCAILPARYSEKLKLRPSRWMRLLRVLLKPWIRLAPARVWEHTQAGWMWRLYHSRNLRGERLAARRLEGTGLVPERIEFPPLRVRVAGWPRWVRVSEATERVEDTLHHRLSELAAAGRFAEVEVWLERFLTLRQAGWRLGLFSMDAHLKNFGVIGDRVVLLDPGGLTDHWREVEQRLDAQAEYAAPHIELGLGPILRERPDVAARFNIRWREVVSPGGVRKHWPAEG